MNLWVYNLLINSNSETANFILETATNLLPRYAFFKQLYAEHLARSGRWDRSVRAYRDALKIDPNIGVKFYKYIPVKTSASNTKLIEDPIFIIGCGHSGTSLMTAILGHHPNIMPIPRESALFLNKDDKVLKRMAEWDEQCSDVGAKRWLEKTPPHIFQIGRFLKMRPKAKFILMLRDGRDVVCSLKKREGYEAIEDRIDRWIYDNMAGLPYWDHPQVRVIKYESLIENTRKALREICEFIDEEYTDDLLMYHEEERRWYSDEVKKPDQIANVRDHQMNRNWQINQPIFDGRGRWRQLMSEEELITFQKSEASELMLKFGYV